MKTKHVHIACLTGSILLLFCPFFLNFYWMRILTNIFMYAILAQSINIIAGYTGYPAFGNVVFFGLGAYTTAISMVKYNTGFVTGLFFCDNCLYFVCLIFWTTHSGAKRALFCHRYAWIERSYPERSLITCPI